MFCVKCAIQVPSAHLDQRAELDHVEVEVPPDQPEQPARLASVVHPDGPALVAHQVSDLSAICAVA